MSTLKRRKLGKTPLDFSEITLGLWTMTEAGEALDDAAIIQTIRAAIEEGVNVVDMAPLWGDGRAERLVAEALSPRDAIQFVTRAGVVRTNGRVHARYGVADLRADCEASLKRLKTTSLALWMLHDPPEDVVLEDDVFALAKRLKVEGKIRAFGVSTSQVDVARLAMSRGVDAVCLPFHILHSADKRDLEADLETAQCGVLARSPLCHGLLTGRWTSDRSFLPADHRMSRWSKDALRARVKTVHALRFLVHDDVTSLTAAALRFVLAGKHVISAVLGARLPRHLEDLSRLVGSPPYLPDEDMNRLKEVLAEMGV